MCFKRFWERKRKEKAQKSHIFFSYYRLMILTLHTSAGPTLGRSNAERPYSQAQQTFFKSPNSFMTDQEIVSSLIAREASVTEQFFFKDCRPLLMSVIRRVFEGRVVEYDEIISVQREKIRRLIRKDFLARICSRHISVFNVDALIMTTLLFHD